jgi:hypothetical protein
VLYKVVEPFGPESGDAWTSYINWTHQATMERFDSADGMLREDCFEPQTKEDWKNCVNENFKLNLITNLEYARTIQGRNQGSVIVGVDIELESGYREDKGLLGYDIVEEYCHISLITNWGTDGDEFEKIEFKRNGLIGELNEALALRDTLRANYPGDSHASNCHVWAIYEISP